MNELLVYCRPGFEGDAAAELGGEAIAQGEGWVQVAGAQLPKRLGVFTRQIVQVLGSAVDLPERDRISPIVAALVERQITASELWLEYPDSNDGKALSGFCRRFEPLLRTAMVSAGVLRSGAPRLHLFFPSLSRVVLAREIVGVSSPHPLGIARLRMPTDAPSRSTLKLAEALATLVPQTERTARLKPGMRAVDLGAAPGGWTYQLVSHGLKVIAVDNGPLKGSMAIHPDVTHLRADGFRYKPRQPVDWLVCDMVEQPHRIARLVAQWLAEGHARQAIFNLKLPMKRRAQAVKECFTLIDEALRTAGLAYRLDARQLYHDREEITVYLRRAESPARRGRRR